MRIATIPKATAAAAVAAETPAPRNSPTVAADAARRRSLRAVHGMDDVVLISARSLSQYMSLSTVHRYSWCVWDLYTVHAGIPIGLSKSRRFDKFYSIHLCKRMLDVGVHRITRQA